METSTLLKFTLLCANVIRQSKKCTNNKRGKQFHQRSMIQLDGAKKLYMDIFRITIWIDTMR